MSRSIESGAEKTIGKTKLAAFSMTALAIQALATLLIVFLPEFYSNAIGLPVAAVGVAFMTVRIVDMAIDPVLGAMMDATRTRWGRFRPWLAASAPVLMVSILMLLQAERGVSILYLWFWLAVCFIGFSMIVLSHLAWTATLSSVPSERTRVFAWWQVFATAGQFSILTILPLASGMRPDDKAFGMQVAGWVMAILIPCAIALALKTMPEKLVVDEGEKRGQFTELGAFFRLCGKYGVIRLLLADLAIALATGVANAVALFYYMGQLGFDRASASALVLVAYSAAFIGTPIFTKLAGRIGKARALQAGALLQAIMQIMVALQPPGNYLLTAATVAILGLCIPIAWFLPRAMMADVADAIRLESGRDRTGLLYASLNGSMKLALGLAVGLAFTLLGWLNFEPSQASDPSNAMPLRLLIGAVPACLSLLVVACMHRFPEAANAQAAKIARDLEQQGQSGASSATVGQPA